MRIRIAVFRWIGSLMRTIFLVVISVTILFVGIRGNQPMAVVGVPDGMTYFDFLGDRLEAARTVEPSRCGWGMLASWAVFSPIYALVYTEVGIHPDGMIAKFTAADPDIPQGVAGATWMRVPGIWWATVERLSWRMLGEPAAHGCQLRPVLEQGS